MTQFSGVDVVLKHEGAWGRVRDVVSAVLSVSPARVRVIDDLAQYPDADEADVVCHVSQVGGQFPVVLSVQCELAHRSVSASEFCARIAKMLRVQLLAPNQGNNPYAMWLIDEQGAAVLTSIDPEAFEDGRYDISESRG